MFRFSQGIFADRTDGYWLIDWLADAVTQEKGSCEFICQSIGGKTGVSYDQPSFA
jgi:hypothetical protein